MALASDYDTSEHWIKLYTDIIEYISYSMDNNSLYYFYIIVIDRVSTLWCKLVEI